MGFPLDTRRLRGRGSLHKLDHEWWFNTRDSFGVWRNMACCCLICINIIIKYSYFYFIWILLINTRNRYHWCVRSVFSCLNFGKMGTYDIWVQTLIPHHPDHMSPLLALWYPCPRLSTSTPLRTRLKSVPQNFCKKNRSRSFMMSIRPRNPRWLSTWIIPMHRRGCPSCHMGSVSACWKHRPSKIRLIALYALKRICKERHLPGVFELVVQASLLARSYPDSECPHRAVDSTRSSWSSVLHNQAYQSEQHQSTWSVDTVASARWAPIRPSLCRPLLWPFELNLGHIGGQRW